MLLRGIKKPMKSLQKFLNNNYYNIKSIRYINNNINKKFIFLNFLDLLN